MLGETRNREGARDGTDTDDNMVVVDADVQAAIGLNFGAIVVEGEIS